MGAFDDGWSTTEFPVAIAGPILCVARFNGKLNGVIAPITPKGSFLVNIRPFSELIVSPRSSFA